MSDMSETIDFSAFQQVDVTALIVSDVTAIVGGRFF